MFSSRRFLRVAGFFYPGMAIADPTRYCVGRRAEPFCDSFTGAHYLIALPHAMPSQQPIKKIRDASLGSRADLLLTEVDVHQFVAAEAVDLISHQP